MLEELTFISSTVAQVKISAKHKFDKPIKAKNLTRRSHFRQLKAIIRLVNTKLPSPQYKTTKSSNNWRRTFTTRTT